LGLKTEYDRLCREIAGDEASKNTSYSTLTLRLSHQLKQAKNLEKDLEILRMLVSLWDEGGGSP
jgi:hypothetical protein